MLTIMVYSLQNNLSSSTGLMKNYLKNIEKKIPTKLEAFVSIQFRLYHLSLISSVAGSKILATER